MKLQKFLIISLFLHIIILTNYIITGKQQSLNYKESLETIENPGAGYTSPVWIKCAPGSTPIVNPTGNINLLLYGIGGFSAGYNGNTLDDGTYVEGKDYDLDETFFNGLRKTFQNVRNNGGMISLRFRYDDKGKTKPEPITFDKVLYHMQQIKESGILEEYKDIIAYVESGFVGAWGEHHSGKYCSYEYKAKTLEGVLNMVPEEISVSVRSPNTVAEWLHVPLNELDKFVSVKGTKEARVGMYNDGYMGSGNDLGTYVNRKIETDWMANQMRYSYYGGEFSGDIEFAKKSETYLPQNSIPEMYKTHLSYINGNIFQLYKDYTFGKEYDVEGVDNSAYYGQTVFKFIRDHLGYRLVLRSSDVSENVEQGGVLYIKSIIENTGFASPIKKQRAEIILEKNGNYYKIDVDIDSTEWYSKTKNEINLQIKLPGLMEPGKWNIYFKLSIGKYTIETYNRRSVKFANFDIWNSVFGANKLGTFTVLSTYDRKLLLDPTIYQLNSVKEIEKSNGELISIKNLVRIDGGASLSDWSQYKCNETPEGHKIYVTNDNKNLYIMAELLANVASNCVNIRVKSKNDGNSYWFYKQSNGFIYFSKSDYTGLIYKPFGNYYQYMIPLGDLMNIHLGTYIETIRVFIQDTANSWVGVASAECNNYIVKDDFIVYSSYNEVLLKEGEDFTMNVETSLEKAEYQWFLDDEKIKGATNKEYTIKSIGKEKIGIYSVNIKSPYGSEKKVDIYKVLYL